MLQELMNYPVYTTGLVTAPRGFGTFISMIVVGRLVGRIDPRIIIGSGFLMMAISLWQMTGFNLQMDSGPVIWTGLLQGFGVGFAFVPLSTVAFVTLAPQYRNEGTAFFSLMRNIGSSIGISVVEAVLIRNTQVSHSDLVTHITPYNLNSPALAANHIDINTQVGVAQLNALITEQATMIAYLNDFKLMMILTFCLMPLLLFIYVPKRQAGAAPTVHVAME
jgi:DHA2 family multidrug resistance protein